jgi:hypothetical protein
MCQLASNLISRAESSDPDDLACRTDTDRNPFRPEAQNQ